MTNKELLLAVGQEWFVDVAIQISQMVSDNKLNSTNAKILFQYYYDQWEYWNRHVNKAVTT